jgi:hypothetical protein
MARTATTTPTDEDAQRDVLRELKWDAQLSPNEIEAAVKNGVVTLTGVVDSYHKKWAAERAASHVAGAEAVVNEIEVRLPGYEEFSDRGIAESAARALELDTLIPTDTVKGLLSPAAGSPCAARSSGTISAGRPSASSVRWPASRVSPTSSTYARAKGRSPKSSRSRSKKPWYARQRPTARRSP